MIYLSLIRIIKTDQEKNYKIHKEVSSLFDKVYVIDISEEKKAKEYLRLTNTEIIETSYETKYEKINQIIQGSLAETWVMILEENDVIEVQTIEKIKKQLEETKEDAVKIYEIEERKEINTHTAIAKTKVYKVKKDATYDKDGVYRIDNKLVHEKLLREEYLREQNEERNKYEHKNFSKVTNQKVRAAILRRRGQYREAQYMYEQLLKKAITTEERKEIINELMMIYIKNNQFKKIEEFIEENILKEKQNKEFHYLVSKYGEAVEAYDLSIEILNDIEKNKENKSYHFIENNKINNLSEKYELAKKSLNEELIIKTILENIQNNNDAIKMHVDLNKLILYRYGREAFERNLVELYQTAEEKVMMYNVMHEMGQYQQYEKEIRENIKKLENQEIAKMYTSQYNEEGRKQALDFSKIHSKKIHALIYNLTHKNEEITENLSTEKTLKMLIDFLEKPYMEVPKQKYKKSYYIKLLKEINRIGNQKVETQLLSIAYLFEDDVKKEIAEMYIDNYDYENAAKYLELYTLTTLGDKKANKKLARIYKKLEKKDDYIRLQLRIIKQEPQNKYQIEMLLNDIENEIENDLEKEKIYNEIKRINPEIEKEA